MGPSTPSTSGWPSARASASTTSARPPVFAHGSHSAARNATRNPIGVHGSPAPDRRTGAATVRLNRFTWPRRTAIMRAHEPRLHPVDPGGKLSLAAPSGRPPAARLQPPLGVGPADAEPVEPDRPDGLDALSQPDPGHQRPDRVVPTPRRREVPGRIPRRPGRIRSLYVRRLRALVPPPTRRQARWPDRLLLRRIRDPRVAGYLLGRPGGPGRRSHEVGQRHGPAVPGRWAAVPQGLLPPIDRRGRPPGTQLPRLR